MIVGSRKNSTQPTNLLPIRYSHSLFLPHSHSSFLNSPPCEGRAERRWRSDACEAPVSACHDRHADASRFAQTGQARLAIIAHHGRTRRAIDLRKPDKPGLREASCVPSDGDARLSALHVGFLARARARRCPAFPPGSCGDLIRRTGHRYPEEQVSRTSPAQLLPAPGTPHLAPPCRTPPEAPLLERSRG